MSRKLNVEISSKMNAMSRAFSHLLTATSATANWVAMRSHQFQQQRFMSKYLSKSATKRLPLTTKKAGKGYYKGKGGTKEGRITSKARFIVDPRKRLELVVPDLEGFKVCYRVFVRFVGMIAKFYNFVSGIPMHMSTKQILSNLIRKFHS